MTKKLNKAEEKGNTKKAEKLKAKKEAQAAANANLDAYRKHHSGIELYMQNVAAASFGTSANWYRHARARGNTVMESVAEAYLPIAGLVMRMSRDKKAYGKRIVLSGMDENPNNVL